ncbi:NAD(P)-dependent oxidoreductase [Streptomyces sp. NPDC005811]|uniref:2-hydroxyacid dehydrogenase n=1 Tax=Streptomyces sp. NPDC005811 TaxID=3154565 RepID=UPI0033CC1030
MPDPTVPAPTVVALGSVDPALVQEPLREGAVFVAHPGPDDLAAAVGAIVRADAVVDRDALDRMPHLRVLARTGVGVDLVDVAEATQRGIAVVITPDSGSQSVAEGVMGMALHLVKRFGALNRLVRDGQWARRGEVAVGDLCGATIGIVGFGRIGRRVAALAEAFGMRVLAHDPFTAPPDEINCPDLAELAAQSDVITLHAPLTDANRHLVDQGFLTAAKPGAVLVNCGRGGLVDLDAVLGALNSGRLSGVGLDVYDPEPPAHHPLFDHPDVLLTPHRMGWTTRAEAVTYADAARGVTDVLAGRRPAALANPEWAPVIPLEDGSK